MIAEEELQWLRKLILEGNTDKFYKKYKWRKTSNKAKERDNNECQHCKREGRVGHAEQVHHIKSLKEYPYLAYDMNNLVSLCKSCHNKQHPERIKITNKKKESFFIEERW